MAEQETTEEATETVETVDKPEGGTDFVEITDPKVEKRFKKLYWNLKQNESITQTLAQQNKTLLDRLEAHEAKSQESESKSQLDSLRDAERAAMEEGDFSKAAEVRDKITDLKVLAVKPQETQKEESWLTPDRERVIADWASETDADGEFVRPWAGDETHEDFELAKGLAIEYIAKNRDADLNDILKAVDGRMNRVSEKPRSKQAAVLSNGGDIRPRTQKKSALSEDEKRIARLMYPNDAKAMDRYAKAKEKLQ